MRRHLLGILLFNTRPAGDALAVMTSRKDLPLPAVLQLLQSRADDVRWRYLHHLVHLTLPLATHPAAAAAAAGATPPTAPSPAPDAPAPDAGGGATSSPPPPAALQLSEEEVAALHTELALELVECIAREVQQQQQQRLAAAEPPAPEGAGAAAATLSPASSRASSALIMSSMPSLQHAFSAMMMAAPGGGGGGGGAAPVAAAGPSRRPGSSLHHHHHLHHHGGEAHAPPPDPAALSRLGWLRAALSAHLAVSRRYDADIVLEAVQGTAGAGDLLLHEQVQLQQRRGDHATALRLLVVRLGDVDSAIGYCRQQQHALVAAQQQRQQGSQQQRQGRGAGRGAGGSGRGAAAAAVGEAVSAEVERLWMDLLECCLRCGGGGGVVLGVWARALAHPRVAALLHLGR